MLKRQPSPSLLVAPRSTPRDSWRWMRWDLPLRVVPLLAAPLLLVWLTPVAARDVGLTVGDARAQLLAASALGPAMGWLSWWYRKRYVSRVVVPTGRDNLLQGFYYVVLNAPAEELFFRGLLIGGLRGVIGPVPALLVGTVAFALYHVPARWGWAAVAGVGVGGMVFGLLFLSGPAHGSLLLPTLVHAFATCGFLSAGPWVAHRLEARRELRRPGRRE